jgi:hypothetical protein
VGAGNAIGALGFIALHFGEGVEVLGRKVLGQSRQLLGTELALGIGEFLGPIARGFDNPDLARRSQEVDSARFDGDRILQFAILGEIISHFAGTARHGE